MRKNQTRCLVGSPSRYFGEGHGNTGFPFTLLHFVARAQVAVRTF